MQTLARPDGTLVYEVAGKGPPLLLVTGLGGSRAYWTNLLPELSARFTVILHDHMGTGQTVSRRSTHTVEKLADDVIALMDHLGVGKAHLLGHSTGAAIGQVIAQDWPERLDKLILYAGWAGPDPFFELCFACRGALITPTDAGAYHRASPLFLYPPLWIKQNEKQVVLLIDTAIRTTPAPDVLKARIAMLLAFDRRARMCEITAPTFVVCAADDQLTPLYLSQELASGIPGATLFTIPWGAHAVSQTSPAEFCKIVLECLAG